MNIQIDWENLALYWGLTGMIAVGWYNYGAARLGKTLNVYEDFVLFLLGPVELVAAFCIYAGRKAMKRTLLRRR